MVELSCSFQAVEAIGELLGHVLFHEYAVFDSDTSETRNVYAWFVRYYVSSS